MKGFKGIVVNSSASRVREKNCTYQVTHGQNLEILVSIKPDITVCIFSVYWLSEKANK